jgi:hypothetical protein
VTAAIGADMEIWKVSCLIGRWIQQSMDRRSGTVDMRPGGLEVDAGTVALLVKMQSVPAWRQVLEFKLHQDAARAVGQHRRSDVLAGGALDGDQ